jgi:ribosome biogenesis GTPase A
MMHIHINNLYERRNEMSYLVIEKMKLVVEIADIEDIETSEKSALDEMVNEKNIDEFDIDIDETEVSDLSFKEATILYKSLDMIKTLLGINTDKLLLYWLTNRDIEYEVESDIDVSKYQRDGYVILES